MQIWTGGEAGADGRARIAWRSGSDGPQRAAQSKREGPARARGFEDAAVGAADDLDGKFAQLAGVRHLADEGNRRAGKQDAEIFQDSDRRREYSGGQTMNNSFGAGADGDLQGARIGKRNQHVAVAGQFKAACQLEDGVLKLHRGHRGERVGGERVLTYRGSDDGPPDMQAQRRKRLVGGRRTHGCAGCGSEECVASLSTAEAISAGTEIGPSTGAMSDTTVATPCTALATSSQP